MPEYKPYNPRERYEQTATEAGRRRLGVIEYSPAKRNPARPRNTRSPFAGSSEGGSPGFFSSLWETIRYLVEDAVDNWRLRRETGKLKPKDEDDLGEDPQDSDLDDPAEALAPRSQNQQAQPRTAVSPEIKSAPDQRNRQQTQQQAQRNRDRQRSNPPPRSPQQEKGRERPAGQRHPNPPPPRKPDLRDMVRSQLAANRPSAATPPATKPQPQLLRNEQPSLNRPTSPAGQTRRDLSRLHQSRRPKNDNPQPPNP